MVPLPHIKTKPRAHSVGPSSRVWSWLAFFLPTNSTLYTRAAPICGVWRRKKILHTLKCAVWHRSVKCGVHTQTQKEDQAHALGPLVALGITTHAPCPSPLDKLRGWSVVYF